MKKFVFLYNSDSSDVPSTDDTDVWMEWFDTFKESTLDMGNPLMEGMNVTSAAVSKISPEMNPISGYTLIEVKDMDAAIAIAKRCPGQSGVQVYEAQEM